MFEIGDEIEIIADRYNGKVGKIESFCDCGCGAIRIEFFESDIHQHWFGSDEIKLHIAIIVPPIELYTGIFEHIVYRVCD